MLKPYICRREYKIDDGEWTLLNTYTALLEEDGSDYNSEFQVETALTFDEVWGSTQEFGRIYADKTIFRKRRKLWIHDIEHIDPVQVLDGQCDQLSFRDTREKAPHTTLKYLMEHLPSDIVIRYLKDNWLAACPLQ